MKTFVTIDTSTKTLPKLYNAINDIGNVGLQVFAKDKRFEKTFKANIIADSKPNGNQVDLVKIDTKPSLDDSINVYVFLNAESIKTARQGTPNSKAKDSAENADADMAMSINVGWLEIIYQANGLKAYTTTNGNKKPTPDFTTDIKKLGCGVKSQKPYAMQGMKDLTVETLANLEIIKSLEVAPYEPPTDNGGNKRSRLYCVVGCDINELITQQFKTDDIASIQRVLTCKVHKGTLQTEPIQIKKAQKKIVAEVITQLN